MADPLSPFQGSDISLICGPSIQQTGWSNETAGDLDVLGSVTIIGSRNDETIIDAVGIDRVVKVHPGGRLNLDRVTITGGRSPIGQGGGGILSAGELTLSDTIIQENIAIGASATDPLRGGGVAVWNGTARLYRSWITENESDFGGGVFFCEPSSGSISHSTLSHNHGGGLHSHSDSMITLSNSTLSANSGGLGAIFHGKRDSVEVGPGSIQTYSISDDGRYVLFRSNIENLVPGDTNGEWDYFLRDRSLGTIRRVSFGSDWTPEFRASLGAKISTDGFFAFVSDASNLVPNDTNDTDDVFLLNWDNQSVERISLAPDGTEVTGGLWRDVSVSADGRYVAFASNSDNLVLGDTNRNSDVFVYDRRSRSIERISVDSNGNGGNGDSYVGSSALSDDGRYLVYSSSASNLVAGDTNNQDDVFIYDQVSRTTQRVPSNEFQQLFINGPSISADGQLVAFYNTHHVFVFDRPTQSIKRLSSAPDGSPSNRDSWKSSLSRDGRFVTFESYSSDLIAGDLDDSFELGSVEPDIFLYDLTNDSIQRLSVLPDGSPLDGGAYDPVLNRDASMAAFTVFHGGANNLYLFDQTSSEYLVVIDSAGTTLEASQVTIVDTNAAPYSVSGQVHLSNSMLSNAGLGMDPQVTRDNVVGVTPFIQPLVSIAGAPPVHPLTQGNVGIDSGSERFVGGVDQLGSPRKDPDIGAYESLTGKLSGHVFADTNADQVIAADEIGVPAITVIARNGDGRVFTAVSRTDDPNTATANESGLIDFDQLPIGNYEIEVVPPPFWKVSQPTVTYIRSDEDFFSVLDRPDISGDGQFIGVTSALADLVPGDGNDDFDVFLLDRASDHFERVSHGGDGTEGNGPSSGISISPDGRFVAFNSRASNLVGDDTNGSTDVFVVDRTSQTIERISVDNNGVEGNLSSAKPQISADGRYVAFHSIASNLVPNDDNNEVDVFVFDRQLKTVRRLSVDAAGEDKNYPSTVNSISTDGTLISFSSQAILVTPGAAEAVFVADHQNGTIEQISLKSDGTPFSRAKDSEISGDGRFVAFRGQMDGGDNDEIYLHDRVADTMYLVSRAFDGGVADGNSFLPSVNEDGRYVAFDSTSSNLVSGDTNGLQDLFVHDVISGETARVSVGFDGSEANGRSSNAKISDDGRWIAFWSYASNLVEGDVNELGDYFVVANPLLSAQTSRTVLAGGVDSTLDLGLIPDPGQIYGVLFEDLVANGALDTNEPRMEGWTVFLDDNRNGMVDTNETVTTTDAEGAYVLSAIPSFREYSVAVAPPTGWQQVSPIGPSGSAYKIFLPAGGDIGGRDFGFRKIVGTGQSTSSSVSGRITDAQGAPLEDIVVYLDSQNFGVRDPNEPATQTDQFGDYYLDSLGSSIVAVSTELGQDRMQISPLGSDFQLATTPLFDEVQPFANPQAIAVADFNSDGAPDIALALAEANKISIRLNNGNGGFLPDQIDIDLGQTGSGPTSLVVGQFNGPGTGLDIAATSNLASNVVLLYDFVGTGFNFQTYIAVGQQPTDIASVAIQGDSNYQDLVVTNSADNTVQVLANQSGFFSAKSPVSTGGVTPVALVAGRFGGGTHFDVAVVHASPSGNGPFGDVRILFGDAQSNLALSPSIYTVGAFPTDMVAANLDGDPNDTLDLAIPNFGSNSISILTGNGDGTFTSQTQTLGTARGAMDIVVADIENDGDPDILTGNLLDRNISIFRNKTTTPHATSFEPLEAIGLGQFSVAQRMPLAVANFDQDHSAPGGMGTVDIITIPSQSDTLHVLTNNLIDGSHRVQLTGLNQVVGLDFVVQPMILPPSLAPIPNPLPILEDDSERTIELVGIAKGRPGGPDLVFEVVSSDPNLIPHPTVGHVSGTSTANLVFTPVQHANGTAMITVTVTDAGANQTFGDSDDGTVVQAFSVIVNPVNDPPTFVIPSLISASQKAGPQSIDTFAANLSPGGGSDEATQVLTDFTVLAENGLLFSSPPAIDRQGRLTFTPDPNKSGITIVQVSLSDDGGRNFGGIDTTTKLFAINVLPVNDPPTINLRGDVTVSAGAGPYLDTGFATGFDPGSGDDDASQVISDFIVSVDRPDLFAIIPDISNDGTLRFTPLASATGKVTVTVQVRDDGGRSNGGNDLSSEQEFTITFATSPEVESVTINDGSSASRSLVTSLGIVFTGEVDHTTLAEAFTLTNIDSGNQVGVIAVVASDSGGKTSALLTFSGTSTVPRVGGNSLTDGNYRLNIVASRITTPGGAQAMTSDFQFGGQTADDSNNDDFFRLFGDTDGDGDVDGQDFGRFGLTFLKLQGDANHNPDLDSDGDGDVDGQDYGRFEQNFLRHL
ncbi:MAG: VCBS repeat-containing protein [Planctomycetales bacterium]|nr:VCBS repeat-containing protein [Planctomycetales bacterium]